LSLVKAHIEKFQTDTFCTLEETIDVGTQTWHAYAFSLRVVAVWA